MISKKYLKKAFTLTEVMITLTIIGIVAILIMPTMIKDVNSKSNMTALRNAVVNLSNAVSMEMTDSRARVVESTTIVSNPSSFLRTLDVSNKSSFFASSYKNYYGSSVSVTRPTNVAGTQGAVLLKNGVALGLVNKNSSATSDVIIDINGPNAPNIVGVDYYILTLAWHDDISNGIQAGDVGGFQTNYNASTLKSNCKNGNGKACFKLAEQGGFDPLYLEK